MQGVPKKRPFFVFCTIKLDKMGWKHQLRVKFNFNGVHLSNFCSKPTLSTQKLHRKSQK